MRERLLRLFLPILVWGLLLSHSGSGDSCLGWYTHFFTLHTADEDGYFMGGYTWCHLWFILYLFVCLLLLLPLMQWLRRERGERFIARLGRGRRQMPVAGSGPG